MRINPSASTEGGLLKLVPIKTLSCHGLFLYSCWGWIHCQTLKQLFKSCIYNPLCFSSILYRFSLACWLDSDFANVYMGYSLVAASKRKHNEVTMWSPCVLAYLGYLELFETAAAEQEKRLCCDITRGAGIATNHNLFTLCIIQRTPSTLNKRNKLYKGQ